MKNAFSLRTTSSFITCALALGLSGLWPAQAQPTPAKVAPDALADTPLDIDPQAKTVFEALVARYKNLNSYSDVTTLMNQDGRIEWSAEIAWEHPNKALVVRKQGTTEWRGVSDGTTAWAVTPEHPDYYLQRAADADRLYTPFGETDTSGPGFGFLLSDYSFERAQQDGLRVLRLQGEEKVDGVSTRLLTFKNEFVDGGSAVTTCYIGVEDGLLHQVISQYIGMAGAPNFIEKHSAIRINPELSPDLWKFTPPAGRKPIDYYSKLEPHRFDPLYKIGDLLPSFDAIDLNGKKVSLADYGDEGKAVLILFFSVRNAVFDVESLKELLDHHQKEGLEVVSVSMDARRPAVEEFVKTNNVKWPVVFDGQGWQNAVATKYGVRSLPMVFLVGRDGRLLLAKGHPYYSPEFEKALADALKTPK